MCEAENSHHLQDIIFQSKTFPNNILCFKTKKKYSNRMNKKVINHLNDIAPPAPLYIMSILYLNLDYFIRNNFN